MALGPCAPNADLGNDKVLIKSRKKIEHSEENRSGGKKIGALGVGKSLMNIVIFYGIASQLELYLSGTIQICIEHACFHTFIGATFALKVE